MATNTDRINALSADLTRLGTPLEERTDQFREADKEQKDDIKSLEDRVEHLQQRVATLEQRCAGLEKLSDRSWQVWLALIGAAIALVVSLVKK